MKLVAGIISLTIGIIIIVQYIVSLFPDKKTLRIEAKLLILGLPELPGECRDDSWEKPYAERITQWIKQERMSIGTFVRKFKPIRNEFPEIHAMLWLIEFKEELILGSIFSIPSNKKS